MKSLNSKQTHYAERGGETPAHLLDNIRKGRGIETKNQDEGREEFERKRGIERDAAENDRSLAEMESMLEECGAPEEKLDEVRANRQRNQDIISDVRESMNSFSDMPYSFDSSEDGEGVIYFEFDASPEAVQEFGEVVNPGIMTDGGEVPGFTDEELEQTLYDTAVYGDGAIVAGVDEDGDYRFLEDTYEVLNPGLKTEDYPDDEDFSAGGLGHRALVKAVKAAEEGRFGEDVNVTAYKVSASSGDISVVQERDGGIDVEIFEYDEDVPEDWRPENEIESAINYDSGTLSGPQPAALAYND